jgi:RNA-directed DNA polymerase
VSTAPGLSLADLLSALDHLLQEPEANADTIAFLLDANRARAEYEVARFLVDKRLGPHIGALLESGAPGERMRGLRLAASACGRGAAASALRRLAKDPVREVRAVARALSVELGLSDVALPDRRYEPPRHPAFDDPGGWNATGWLFGLRVRHEPPRQRAQPGQGRGKARRLPALSSADDVARLLGLGSGKALRSLVVPGAGPRSAYVEFLVPKATGGMRLISAPTARLRRAQRALLDLVLSKVELHDACHGFVRGRSTVSNARPHAGAALVVKCDLKDFFPTIHYRRVAGLFEQLGYGREVSRVLAGLTTHCKMLPDGSTGWPGTLPQGAPTSPAIANLVCRRLDARLSGLAERLGGAYTRYADDLTFSFAEPPSAGLGRFFWWVDQICQQEGFEEHRKKRRVFRAHQQQRVTGIVVNDAPAVPREARRRFRAILHNCRASGVEAEARGREDFESYLHGFAAYVKMVQPPLGEKLAAEVKALFAGRAAHR